MNSKKNAAYALLAGQGFDFRADFHTLGSEKVEQLVMVAKAVGYRAGKNRNGSTARCFFEYLARGEK